MISQQFSSGSSSSSDISSKRMLGDAENGSSLFLFLLALAVLLGAAELGLGTVSEPGPGFLPFLAAVVLATLALHGANLFSRLSGHLARAWLHD